MFDLISLADAFTEELLFRGLFLKKLGHVIGSGWANLATAAVYALAHLSVQFAKPLPAVSVTTFLLGLLLGWIMQRTRSVLAPAFIHAGADMLIISDAFRSFGLLAWRAVGA